MRRTPIAEAGFTLVELMAVVLIIGVLVSIAVPVFRGAVANARASACQANQRTIDGIVELYRADAGTKVVSTNGLLQAGGSGWYDILIPHWVNGVPTCPQTDLPYLVDTSGTVIGDQGLAPGFFLNHDVP